MLELFSLLTDFPWFLKLLLDGRTFGREIILEKVAHHMSIFTQLNDHLLPLIWCGTALLYIVTD
jgi:hypothetical protein